jgi:hypothetical protein
MNKEEKNSHVLAFRRWLVYFSPYCRATPQGIREKYGKHRVIFDSSTQTWPDEIVLNLETTTENEAVIDFGKTKRNLLTNIYNWQISYPRERVFLALTDITACFRFQWLAADVTGAFGFLTEYLYFTSTSLVFGSNTSASSWEPFRRAIQTAMITVFFPRRKELAKKHEQLLDELLWSNDVEPSDDLTRAFPCKINTGVLDESGNLKPMTASIYVDDILAAAAFKENMRELLAAIIESIFTICGTPDVAVRQECPLSLEKWHELIIGPRKIVLGLVVGTDTMMVGITNKYI